MILGYSQIGYYFIWLKSQYELKERMLQKVLQQIKNEDVNIISLTDNADKIYWEDEDEKNEFSFNGAMYDIVRTETVNGNVLLYCINDKKEEQLIDTYNSITKNNSTEDKKANDNLNDSINLFVYEDVETKSLRAFSTSTQFYIFVSHLAKGVTVETSPPPKA